MLYSAHMYWRECLIRLTFSVIPRRR
jgi:hypothetical protein